VASSVTNILASAQDKVKFANVKSQFSPIGNIPVFSLLFVFNVDEMGDQTLNNVDAIANELKLSHFAASLELSHKPGDSDTSWICSRFNLEGGVNRTVLRALLEEVAKELPSLLPFILLKNAEVTINFDSVNELLDATGRTAGMVWPIKNWADLVALESEIGPVLLDEDLPAPLVETYDNCAKMLQGLHSAQMVNGDHVLDITFEGFDIFTLLPTIDQLKKKTGEETEFIDKLRAKDVSKKCCTFKKTGRTYMRQSVYACAQCEIDGVERCICEVCAVRCHAGHTGMQPYNTGAAFCDCPDMGNCKAMKKDKSK